MKPSLSYDLAGEHKLLETIIIVLIGLWLLGMVTTHSLGAFVHVLLVIAVIVILVRVIQGRKPL